MQTDQMLADVVALIHKAYPDRWIIIPSSLNDPQVVIHTLHTRTIINSSAPITFLVTDRSTGEPLMWGEADSVNDAMWRVHEWLTIPTEWRRLAA
jgi:hypothetical protein